MRLLLILIVALVTAAPTLCEQSPDVGIREAVQNYVRAFNAGDADAAAATYTPNGTHTYAVGATHRGRTEIARGLHEMFAGPLKGAKISIETLRITPLSETIAVEEEAFSLDGLQSPSGERLPQLRGLCLAVHQYLDGKWSAAAVQCLVPPPPPDTK
jgi:uncharacterized protein (TIGR02246 family)